MSGRSYDDYRDTLSRKGFTDFSSGDEETKTRLDSERKKRVVKTRSVLSEKSELELLSEEQNRENRDVSKLYDRNFIRDTITQPNVDTKRVHIVIIDNSGSNKIIAEHFRKTSGYFTSVLNIIDPTSQIAFMYYSDHCDGVNINQEVDFVSPNEEGDKVLFSTLQNISPAGGGDYPEAFECALWEACDIKFGKAEFKHLYLITDEVAHGMGEDGDDGCPNQRFWKDSVTRVYNTYDSFEVVGCGNDPRVGKLQAQFIQKPDRLIYDLMDLSSIEEDVHRKAIVSNALLFLVARKTGLQTLELFLSYLYEKWIEEHIFGKDSAERAKQMIVRFGKFIEAPDDEIQQLMKKIIVE